MKKYNLPKLNEAESLSRPITPDEIASVIKNLLTHKTRGPDGFTGEFYKAFKAELTPIRHSYFKKFKKMEDSQTNFMKPASS